MIRNYADGTFGKKPETNINKCIRREQKEMSSVAFKMTKCMSFSKRHKPNCNLQNRTGAEIPLPGYCRIRRGKM